MQSKVTHCGMRDQNLKYRYQSCCHGYMNKGNIKSSLSRWGNNLIMKTCNKNCEVWYKFYRFLKKAHMIFYSKCGSYVQIYITDTFIHSFYSVYVYYWQPTTCWAISKAQIITRVLFSGERYQKPFGKSMLNQFAFCFIVYFFSLSSMSNINFSQFPNKISVGNKYTNIHMPLLFAVKHTMANTKVFLVLPCV